MSDRLAIEAGWEPAWDLDARGEPETGMGQGEAAEAHQPPTEAFNPELAAAAPTAEAEGNGKGVVSVDFGGLGPAAA